MAKSLVFDTTPLIYVIRVSLSEALGKLENQKFLPRSVYEEIMRGETQGRPEASVMRELVKRGTIASAQPRSASLVRQIIKAAAENDNKPLHRAEAEALVLAKEVNGIVIADDRAARSTAKLIRVELHGTGYLFGMMYRQRLVSKEEAIARISDMRRAGWRLSEDDYRAILNYLEAL